MPQKVAILGLGWLGLPLAKALLEKGHEITGSTTSTEKMMGLLKSHLAIRIIKVRENNVEGNWKNFIEDADVLIINIPPKGNEKYPLQIQQIADRCKKELKVIFVSSTAVYGSDNQTATEESPTVPTKKSGYSILAAESVIQDYFGSTASIIRMAGLFGKDRHPGRFLQKDKVFQNPDAPINLIQLEDCIQLISTVIDKDFFGEIINGCSDQHPKRVDFYNKAAFSINLAPPTFDFSTPSLGKIVDNQKSKDQLDMVYFNPTDFLEQ